MVSKKEILECLNWDLSISVDDLLSLVEGGRSSVGGITRESLFLRSLERVAWHNLVPLWNGVNECCKLYTEKVRRGLRNERSREKFDFVFGLLRGEPVQAPRWGSERCQELQRTFLSDRWNRS